MNTLILACSQRAHSQSYRVAKIIADVSATVLPHAQSTVIDMHSDAIPWWHEDIWNQDAASTPQGKKLTSFMQAAHACDSLVLVVPEYAGMATPVAKNALLLLDAKTVGHKPVLIVSISSGLGGSYPVAELRMSSYKNNRLVWIPDHVIVRYVDDFQEPFEGGMQQQTFKRLKYSMQLLNEYAQGLRLVRQSGILAEQPFPFGM